MQDIAELRGLLRRLDGEPADALESQILELKGWNRNPAARESQIRELRETVVCLANAQGGSVVLGVADGKRSRQDAIQGVGDLDGDLLRRLIYDGTEPHILVDVEELVESEGRLLRIRVPRGLPPHTTTEGVGKIRVGKECKPLTGSDLTRLLVTRGQFDTTAQLLSEASVSDLDPSQLENLRRAVREGGRPELARLSDREILGHLGLVSEERVTLAAILLVGCPGAIARFVPYHEIVFARYRRQTRYDVRHDLRGPLFEVLESLRRLLEAHLRVTPLDPAGFVQLEIPDITWWIAREALVNAVVHRDYFLHQSVVVSLYRDRMEVSSPGGFIGGVTPSNVLRHPPVRRNPLLADVLQTIGLVNRAGLGVDRMYEELLRLGKSYPRYESDEANVRLILPLGTHPEFARFVAKQSREGNELELDDLILLRGVTDRGALDRWSAAELLQLGEEEAAARLVSLRERGYLVAHGRGRGTHYRLARALSDELRGRTLTDRELPLDGEAVRTRVETLLGERGRLANADVRRLTGYSRSETVRLMRRLREDGLAVVRGRGRGAHYEPGPALQQRAGQSAARKTKRGHSRK